MAYEDIIRDVQKAVNKLPDDIKLCRSTFFRVKNGRVMACCPLTALFIDLGYTDLDTLSSVPSQAFASIGRSYHMMVERYGDKRTYDHNLDQVIREFYRAYDDHGLEYALEFLKKHE